MPFCRHPRSVISGRQIFVPPPGSLPTTGLTECICLEESIDQYVWLLLTLAEFEPRFNLNDIKFLFGDKNITQQVVQGAGISDTCLLRCDRAAPQDSVCS